MLKANEQNIQYFPTYVVSWLQLRNVPMDCLDTTGTESRDKDLPARPAACTILLIWSGFLSSLCVGQDLCGSMYSVLHRSLSQRIDFAYKKIL